MIAIRILIPALFCLSLSEAYSAKTPVDSSTAPVVVSAINFRLCDSRRDSLRSLNFARDISLLKSNQSYQVEHLQKTLQALKASKKFSTISVDSLREGHSISFTFALCPYLLVRKIAIKRAFPLFPGEIMTVLSFKSGSVYDEAMLDDARTTIKTLYRREGIELDTISFSIATDSLQGYCDITMDVGQKRFSLLKEIRISGNKARSDLSLKLKMDSWRTRFYTLSAWRYSATKIEKDIARIRDFYHRKRFADCKIDYNVIADSSANTHTVHIRIAEGPRYKLIFADRLRKRKLTRRTIRKQFAFMSKGLRSASGIKQSIRKLEKRYEERGYLQPRIDLSDTVIVKRTGFFTQRQIPQRRLTLSLSPGRQTRVSHVDISGNITYDDRKIVKQMLNEHGRPYNAREMLNDQLAIHSLYTRNGFLKAEIDISESWDPDSSDVALTVDVVEGPQTILSEIEFNGLTVITEKAALRKTLLQTGRPLAMKHIEHDQIVISSLVAEEGYPYVTIQTDLHFNNDSSRVAVIHQAKQGRKVTMGSTYFSGNFKTRQRILKREIRTREGDAFSLRRIVQGQQNLRDFDILNSVSFKTFGLKERADTITLLVDVGENKPYLFEAGFGFHSEDLITARVEAGNRNFMGYNKHISLGGQYSSVIQRGEFSILDPRLFGYRIAAALGTYLQRETPANLDFGTYTLGVPLSFTRTISRNLAASLTTSFTRKQNFDVTTSHPDTSISYDTYPRNQVSLTPSLTFDKRDSFIRPTSGILATASISLTQGFGRNDVDFARIEIDARRYIALTETFTLALLGRAGYVIPTGAGDSIPYDERFVLGGTSTVRGYKRNKLEVDQSGDPRTEVTSLSGSIEARIEFFSNVEVALFFDAGRLAPTLEIDDIQHEFRQAAGGGLRYHTPIGPIGLLYGHKITPRRNANEERGQWHFSIGYTF
ncbi:MAG: BamA/TamA family outer membrane protein [Chitinivibrionales bacterium]|nr:BamA/TamA family outer membrane protein [Chitinivibrionales bacterium]